MSRLLSWLKVRRHLDYPVFNEYMVAVQNFAIGQDRLQWNREALAQQDIALEKVNAEYRDRVFEACHDLIDELEADEAAS